MRPRRAQTPLGRAPGDGDSPADAPDQTAAAPLRSARRTRPRSAPAGMMARQARDTSMITGPRQAHDHQDPCLCHETTRPGSPQLPGALNPRFSSAAPQRRQAPYSRQVQQRRQPGTPSTDYHRPATCPNGRERPRCREFASRGSGVQIPSAPRQGPISNTGPVLYGLRTATLAIELPAQPLESTSGLHCRHLTVGLHRQVI
jgi:hypothetical protein